MRSFAASLLVPLIGANAQDVFLGKSKTDTDNDVIIIGAGWAGMAAADHLAKAGVSFVVLEADNRTGGRTKAFEFGNPSVGTFVFEQGSNWICGSGKIRHDKYAPKVRTNPVKDLAIQEGLSTVLIPGATDGNMSNYFAVYDENGHHADPDGSLRAKANAALDCLNATGSSAGAKVSVRDGLTKCGWVPETNVEWAMDWALASDESGVLPKNSALAGFAPDPTYFWWGKDDLFVADQHPRGFARLIDGMVRDTVPDSKVHLNAWVNKIEWGQDGVTVSTKDGRSYVGKHAIFTASLGVLRNHHEEIFSPALPSKQADALKSNHRPMANLTHVLVQFPSVWWDDSLPAWVSANAGGKANKGLFTVWHNMNHASVIPGSQTLLSFLGEPEASEFGLMSEEELLPLLTERLRTQNPDKDIPDASAAWLKNWGNDPLTYGAYMYSEPGVSWSDNFKKPLKHNKEKIVQFAGEHTCDQLNGYTHGAMQSGKEAAAKYLYQVGQGPKPSTDDSLVLCDWYWYYYV